MKQTRVHEYRPKYPKKLLKGAALTAAALVALGGTACERPLLAGVPMPGPTDELVLDGDIAIETPDPNLTEPGEPMVDEGEDEPALMGKIVSPEEVGLP